MTPAEAIAATAPVADALLPGNATAIERALLAAELARIAEVDAGVIATIYDPARCPAVLLPWLAYAVSVDVWSDAWPEARKRAVIAASPQVHRLKGTLGAVKRSLAAFDLETRIVEWWQDDERPGTFRLEVLYRNGSPVFDLITQAEAITATRAAKPKARVFTTRAVLQARGPVFMGALAQASLGIIAHPFVFDMPTLRATAHVGATAATFFSATAHPLA